MPPPIGILGEILADYVDMGEVHSFSPTLDVFVRMNRDLSIIVYHRLSRKTAVAMGNVTEENRTIAEDIRARVRARPRSLNPGGFSGMGPLPRPCQTSSSTVSSWTFGG